MIKMKYTGKLALPRVVVGSGRDYETDDEGVVEVPEAIANSLANQGWVKVQEETNKEIDNG